jgi:hypothetical protein
MKPTRPLVFQEMAVAIPLPKDASAARKVGALSQASDIFYFY